MNDDDFGNEDNANPLLFFCSNDLQVDCCSCGCKNERITLNPKLSAKSSSWSVNASSDEVLEQREQ